MKGQRDPNNPSREPSAAPRHSLRRLARLLFNAGVVALVIGWGGIHAVKHMAPYFTSGTNDAAWLFVIATIGTFLLANVVSLVCLSGSTLAMAFLRLTKRIPALERPEVVRLSLGAIGTVGIALYLSLLSPPPNSSIERTLSGKPASASHVKR